MDSDSPAYFSSLKLKDGRTLTYQSYGQPGGQPLYFFHGFPGSRLQASLLHSEALAHGVCLIAPDRPGFGRSTPAPKRRILGWADDIAQLADHLGHQRFGVLGASCGGPYALACAYRLPERLYYVGLLAGIGPMDVPAIKTGQLPVLRMMFSLARLSPVLVSPLLMMDYVLFSTNPERAVRTLSSMLTEPDRRLLASNKQVADDFGASLAEAYIQGIGGAMREAHLIGSKPEFALEDISVPVHIYQSGVDRNVPPAMGKYMADRIPGSRMMLYPEEGHLSIVVNKFGECLKDFFEAAK